MNSGTKRHQWNLLLYSGRNWGPVSHLSNTVYDVELATNVSLKYVTLIIDNKEKLVSAKHSNYSSVFEKNYR